MSANTNSPPLARFVLRRTKFHCDNKMCRVVYDSSLLSKSGNLALSTYVADRAPLFYRNLESIVNDLKAGYFLTAFRDTLGRLPSAQSFRESHFGEILAGIFSEEIKQMVRLYSKLTLLTAENANAYKMDLLLCNPTPTIVEFIFGEVKSSCKCAADGLPAGHDKSCFADLFTSFRKYDQGDLEFDLTAARDRLNELPPQNAERIRKALLPYGQRVIKYAAFAIIDDSTRNDAETAILATRKSDKEFDVELISVESLKDIATDTFNILT